MTAAAAPLEVADDPCFVYLSSSGLLARTTTDDAPGTGDGRAKHDVITSAVRSTARGEVGALTSRGRVIKLGVLDLPALPPSANDPHLGGGLPVSEVLPLETGERLLALTALPSDGPGLALGTRDGVVKRVNPEVLNRDEWEVISPQGRRRGRRCGRAGHRHRDAVLHHHRRPAAALRRRQRPAPRAAPAGALRGSGSPQGRRRCGSACWRPRETPWWSPPPAPPPRCRAPSRDR